MSGNPYEAILVIIVCIKELVKCTNCLSLNKNFMVELDSLINYYIQSVKGIDKTISHLPLLWFIVAMYSTMCLSPQLHNGVSVVADHVR